MNDSRKILFFFFFFIKPLCFRVSRAFWARRKCCSSRHSGLTRVFQAALAAIGKRHDMGRSCQKHVETILWTCFKLLLKKIVYVRAYTCRSQRTAGVWQFAVLPPYGPRSSCRHWPAEPAHWAPSPSLLEIKPHSIVHVVLNSPHSSVFLSLMP